MPKRKLTDHLGSKHPISNGLRSLLENETTLRRQVLKKNTPVLIPNMDANEAHYISEGACKAYWLDEDGNEIIYHIWGPNSIMLLPEEFFEGIKNKTIYIVTIRDCVLYTITKNQMDEIYKEYAEAQVMTNIIRSEMKEFAHRHLYILMKRSNERFALFYILFKELWLLGMADKDLKAFLGICQKTLTTGRRELVLRDRRR